ncbi:hypothetical protein D9M72_566730 [compost metagenome]
MQRAAPLDALRRHQHRPLRTSRDDMALAGIDRLVRTQRCVGQRHGIAVQRARGAGLFARIGHAQHRQRALARRK